jgi:hypothetical protein
MKSQARTIRILAGLIAGIAAAVLLMIVSEAAAHRLIPPEAGPDIYAANDPTGPATGTLVGLLAGWFVSAMAGAWLAVRIGRELWTAWIVAAVIILSAVYLFFFVDHPLWMMAAGIAAPLAGAFLGQSLARRGRA